MDDPVMKDEIFGPVMPVISAKNPQEAVDLINKGEKPLTLYVYSENEKVHQKFVDDTSSGSVVVNDCLIQLSVDDLPFGGVGYSGMGAYRGKVSIKRQKKNLFLLEIVENWLKPKKAGPQSSRLL